MPDEENNPPLDLHEIAPERISGDLTFINDSDRALFKSLFCSIPGRAILLDTKGYCRFANQEYFDFVGRSEHEAVGVHVADILGKAVFDSYQPLAARLFSGEPIRWEGWADYGALGKRYIIETVTPYKPDPNGRVVGFLAVARDLTDLKNREQELAARIEQQTAADAYHAAYFRTALDGIVVINECGICVDINPAAETTFGYTREEMVGQPIAGLIIPPEYRAAHAAGMKNYLESGTSRILGKRLELSAIRKDGTTIPIELAITDVTRDGQRLFAAHIRDLSAAKRAEAEIRQQRNALYQKEKLAALGSLLAGVAHELNNPLSIVTGQTMMLREQMLRDAHSLPAYEHLLQRCDRIENAANRCARIVRSFLAMARQREAERKAADLGGIVNEAVDLLNYNLRASGITVETEIAADLPPLMLDANQIHQVLLNLLVNAQQALEEKEGDRKILVSLGLDEAASMVRLSVADNGPGIPAGIHSRIFEPFFTTKPQGTGTGIGLSVSRGLIETHGGTLEIGTAPDGGACFTIQLPLEPATTEAVGENGLQPAGLESPRDGGHVLIVDDEPEIASLLAEISGNFGYVPLVANSGNEAKIKIDQQKGQFAAILCDIRMPDGDGPGLYDWLREMYPDLAARTGFITGDTLGPAAGRFLARSGCPLIEKPFTPADINAFLADLTSEKNFAC